VHAAYDSREMTAEKLPMPKIISDPSPLYVPEARSPGVVLPMPQMGYIHRDAMVLCSTSEPDLTLPRIIQPRDASMKISHTDEQLHASGAVPKLPANGRIPMIRFHSHVRITSGISRHHRKRKVASHVAEIDISISPRSSPSSSRSSSIYAPLRPRSDDENPRSTLGVAQRVSRPAAQKRGRRRSRDGEKIQGSCLCEHAGKGGSKQMTNERTPLLNCAIQSAFEREGINYDFDESNLSHSHAVDFVFGRWPGRLLNPYWWWWKAEPILCCHCLDESDTEY